MADRAETVAPVRAWSLTTDGKWALVLGLIGAAWSSWRIWVPSLWADEGATLSAVQRTWSELWALLGRIDAVHGVYYALMKVWFTILPMNVVTLRLPSLLAVGLLIGLTYLVSRSWFSPAWAGLAAGLVAALPRTTWMAIEGRSWAIGALVVLGATLALMRWRRTGRSGALVAYGLLLVLGISLNIYVVFMVAAHGLSLLMQRVAVRRLARWAVVAVLAMVVSAPVLVAANHEKAQLGDREQLGLFGWARDVVVKQFALGDTPAETAVWVPQAVWSSAAVALALLAWGAIALSLVFAVRDARAGDARAEMASSPHWEALAWTIPWIVLPPTFVLLASLLTDGNLYHPRYFAFAVPAFAIAVVAGLRRIGPRTARVALIGMLVVLTVPVHLSQRDVDSKGGYDWSQVADAVSSGARAGDGVYFGTEPPTRVISLAYPSAFTGMDDFTLVLTPAQEGSLDGESTPLSPTLLRAAPQRIWGVWSNRDGGRAGDHATLVAAGYRDSYRWTGSQSTVILMER